jgi:hypothetical protein
MFRFALTDHICDARPSMRPVTFDWNSRYRRCPKLRPRDADRFFLDPYITPSLNAFRAELGLRPVRRVFHSWLHSPRLTIGIFPDWFPPTAGLAATDSDDRVHSLRRRRILVW